MLNAVQTETRNCNLNLGSYMRLPAQHPHLRFRHTLTAAVSALSPCGWHATCHLHLHLRKWQSKWLLSSCNTRDTRWRCSCTPFTELLLHMNDTSCSVTSDFCGTSVAPMPRALTSRHDPQPMIAVQSCGSIGWADFGWLRRHISWADLARTTSLDLWAPYVGPTIHSQ